MLATAIRQAVKAGAIPTSAIIAPDGSVKLHFGRQDDAEDQPMSYLDNWIAKHAG